MATLQELTDALNSLPARRLQSAAGTRESHAIGDLLDLLDRANEEDALKSRKLPIRLQKLRPEGTV